MLLFITTLSIQIFAQSNGCTFKEPVVSITFGKLGEVQGVNLFAMPNYRQAYSSCPDDGYYSYAQNSSNCFNGDWITFTQDRSGEPGGRMMLVNASPNGGQFFNTVLSNLKPNTTYEFAAWMINVCRINGGCPPLPPNILIKLATTSGNVISSFKTGLLIQNSTPNWTRYNSLFTTPSGGSTLIITMEDLTTGGCGNDFAIDDITIRECIKPVPVKPEVISPAKTEEKKDRPITRASKKTEPADKPAAPATKPEPVKKSTPVIAKENSPIDTENQVKPTPQKTVADIKIRPVIPVPKLIATRANPLIKQILSPSGIITIDLYDNGDIDGDTVTVYHNNELIISKAGLALKSTSFKIKLDASQPHHEIIMVANNLGSIPPNTSMMIVTTPERRYEVFISSSEEKNARVEIDLKP